MELVLKIALGLVFKLLTERFLSRAIVIGLRAIASRTETPYDNELVDALEEALTDAKSDAELK